MHHHLNLVLLSAQSGSVASASNFDNQAHNANEIVLVINDMQPSFKASNDESVLLAVEAEIQLAISQRRPIIVVEYDPIWQGKTHARLLALLCLYDRVGFVAKSSDHQIQRRLRGEKVLPNAADDGSEQIIEGCLEFGFSPRGFRFTGVNADACIWKTARGIKVRLPEMPISVVSKACNSETGDLARDKFERLGCSFE